MTILAALALALPDLARLPVHDLVFDGIDHD
jgi:hypothetical protein